MAAELIILVSRVVLNRLGPELRLAGRRRADRAPDGMRPAEPGNAVLRVSFAVGGQNESFARNCEAATRSDELERVRRALTAAGFAMRPRSDAVGILDQCVLRVG